MYGAKKYLLLIPFILAGIFLVDFTPDESLGQVRVITPSQGGTGIGTATVGNVGQCLIVSDEAPFTYTLGACGTGGDSVSDWQQVNGALTPTSTIGISVHSSSSISRLTMDIATTTYLSVTGTATTSFGGPIHISDNLFVGHGAQAYDSSGFHLHSSNGTGIAYFGVAGGSNSTFEGGVNIDGQTRLATSITGILQAISGVVTATSSISDSYIPTSIARDTELHDAVTLAGEDYLTLSTQQITAIAIDPDNLSASDFGAFTCNGTSCALDTTYEVPLTFSDGLTRTVNNIAPTTGYNIPLTASTTNWEAFYLAPSNRITAGTSLSWSGNTLNVTGAGSASDWKTLNGALTPTSTIGISIHASSTIGGGATSTGLTISGGATTTGESFLAEKVRIKTATSTEYLNVGGGLNIHGNFTFTNGYANGSRYYASAAVAAATSPHYTFSSDTNTGIWNSGADALAFATNGVYRFGIDNSSSTFRGINVGIATGSPESRLDVWGASSGKIATFFSNTGTKFLEMLNTGVTTLLGTWNFAGATVQGLPYYPTFTYATSTTWTGTTTIPLGAAYNAQTWSGVKCFTDTGTVNVDFGDGTNWMNATTSKALNPVPTHTLSSNNTFTAGETRYARVGTPVSTPTKVSCTVTFKDS